GVAPAGDGRHPDPAPRLGAHVRRGPARGDRLGLGPVMTREAAGAAGAAGAGLVLVVNAGSSSLKLSLLDPAGTVTASADLDRWDGSAGTAGLRGFLAGQAGIIAAGHRVVHGGRRFTAPTVIDDKVVAGLADLT